MPGGAEQIAVDKQKQTPATKKTPKLTFETEATKRVVNELPKILVELEVDPSVASFVQKNGAAVVEFAVKRDRTGFNTWLDRQTGFTPEVRSRVLSFFDGDGGVVLVARVEAYKESGEGFEKSAKGDHKGAQESFREARKYLEDAGITEKEVLEAGFEITAVLLNISVEEVIRKYGQSGLEDATKAGFNPQTIAELSEEWGIRPPLELVTPQPPLPEESIVGLKAEFVRNAQQAIIHPPELAVFA